MITEGLNGRERGHKMADAVLDGKWGTTAFDEAENRLHAQGGVMASIIS
jgi:ornithine carbamoyltransferase